MVQIVGIVTAILLAVLIPLIRFVHKRERRLRAYYELRWKKSSSLKPAHIMGLRGSRTHGFDAHYYERPTDELIKAKLLDGESALVTGYPLAGKTRALYEALKRLAPAHDVIVPRVRDIDVEDFLIPRHLAFWRKEILVLDDLDKFGEKQNFAFVLQAFLRRGAIIIASCRSGPEYDKVRRTMERELSSIFATPIEVPRVSSTEGAQVAAGTNRTLPGRFDGNMGSIFLELDAMRERFRACNDSEKAVLRSMARLYYAGIYEGREIFSAGRILDVCREQEGIETKQYQWTDLSDRVEKDGFIDTRGDRIWAEEAYLESVVEHRISTLNNLRGMMTVFGRDPDALFRIGNRASDIGAVSVDRTDYMRVAVQAYITALDTWTIQESPRRHAATQNNLGTAYSRLAEVEETAENCKRAIGAYEQALRVYTFQDFPMQYGTTQNGLGTAYSRLAQVEEKAENCKRAIGAYEEALRVWTFEDFPMDYGTTHNNLGAAYTTLAELEEKAENCKRAIGAYEEALRVRTFEDFPMDYGITQNNLGNAYRTLAEVEEKAENCKRAIGAYEEALRVCTFEDFPIQYAGTQNNLGAAYSTLAEVEEKAENCKRAIGAYDEALKVYTEQDLPQTYQLVQRNLRQALEGPCRQVEEG